LTGDTATCILTSLENTEKSVIIRRFMILGYIDPGQGMLIWQAIVSAFVGLLFYLKKTRQFFAAVFRKIFCRNKPTKPSPSDASTLEIPAAKIETKVEVQ